MSNGVRAWSYSALAQYETCPAQYKYARIDKLPQPEVPAFKRGNRIHKEAEDYVVGKIKEVPQSCITFEDQFKQLRDLDKEAELFVEQEWGFDRNWGRSGWRDWNKTWLRGKVDVGVLYGDNEATIIDHKTGQLYETNEDQIELFALTVMCRFPEITMVDTRLWYLDSGVEIDREFFGKDREKLKKKWEQKVAPMFQDEKFPPRPNFKCKWCPYSQRKGGPCQY